jgi:hypothetical protein
MRVRRATIDRTLDLLAMRGRQARRQALWPASALVAVAVAGAIIWRIRRRRAHSRLRLVA